MSPFSPQAAAVFFLLLSAQSASPQEESQKTTESRWSALLQIRQMKDDALYARFDEQLGAGVEFSHGLARDWGSIGLEAGLSLSSNLDAYDNHEDRSFEIYGGLRVSGPPVLGNMRPYLGAGISWIETSNEVAVGTDDEDATGFYLHGGFLLERYSNVSVGLDFRTLTGTDAEIGGVEGDVDYVQAAVVLSWAY